MYACILQLYCILKSVYIRWFVCSLRFLFLYVLFNIISIDLSAVCGPTELTLELVILLTVSVFNPTNIFHKCMHGFVNMTYIWKYVSDVAWHKKYSKHFCLIIFYIPVYIYICKPIELKIELPIILACLLSKIFCINAYMI